MRAPTHRTTSEGLGRRLQRLDGLPLRPVSARALVAALPDEPADDEPEDPPLPAPHPSWDLDPGWVLAGMIGGTTPCPLDVVACRPWWPSSTSSGPVAEWLDRFWRHSVAVKLAAHRLAREAGDPDPDAVARAGQLCGLGYWALAAVDPEWLVRWWGQDDPARRHQMERADLGSDPRDLGRRLAERWGCPPLVVDAAWLHADRDGSLNLAAASPDRLSVIQEAYRRAERTPWSLSPSARDSMPVEPQLRILVAEVQARCSGSFVDPSASPHEERATRQNVRLRLEVARLRRAHGHAERLLELLGASSPGETPEEWADRAAMSWCATPGVAAARVSWLGEAGVPAGPAPPREDAHPPTVVVPLDARWPARAVAELWCPDDPATTAAPPDGGISLACRRAWGAWVAQLADRVRLERRLQAAVAALRRRIQGEDQRLESQKLAALGEFAAGAGHELNNPLAVIVGRAQLLLARADDPEFTRSLRIILGQAQRAHRILRDLMFVARPPAPRPRLYRAPELLASVVAEFQQDSQARGIRLDAELDDSAPDAWGDADGLRHLAEILLRNALQASQPGGRIVLRSSYKDDALIWSVSDNGKGIGTEEGDHLFDPFYCGRQAGRGLGLGLPRAARIVELAGGTLRWSSTPGRDTVFQVQLPLLPPPLPDSEVRAEDSARRHRPGRMLRS